jgi:hypothetical protein
MIRISSYHKNFLKPKVVAASLYIFFKAKRLNKNSNQERPEGIENLEKITKEITETNIRGFATS